MPGTPRPGGRRRWHRRRDRRVCRATHSRHARDRAGPSPGGHRHVLLELWRDTVHSLSQNPRTNDGRRAGASSAAARARRGPEPRARVDAGHRSRLGFACAPFARARRACRASRSHRASCTTGLSGGRSRSGSVRSTMSVRRTTHRRSLSWRRPYISRRVVRSRASQASGAMTEPPWRIGCAILVPGGNLPGPGARPSGLRPPRRARRGSSSGPMRCSAQFARRIPAAPATSARRS